MRTSIIFIVLVKLVTVTPVRYDAQNFCHVFSLTKLVMENVSIAMAVLALAYQIFLEIHGG